MINQFVVLLQAHVYGILKSLEGVFVEEIPTSQVLGLRLDIVHAIFEWK